MFNAFDKLHVARAAPRAFKPFLRNPWGGGSAASVPDGFTGSGGHIAQCPNHLERGSHSNTFLEAADREKVVLCCFTFCRGASRFIDASSRFVKRWCCYDAASRRSISRSV